ncbi:MAG: Tetraacyldisaccharide 4'-kinase [Chlamydiia bacterium]|nr:Tetraacyldisaccharide 4'-kinase [Chlamydiia bacterium]
MLELKHPHPPNLGKERFYPEEAKRFSPLKLLFWAIGYLFGKLVHMRNFFFDRGLIKSVSIGPYVASIGNITVGGSGKTPLLIHLIDKLQDEISIGLLTRGYRSKAEHRTRPYFIEGHGQRADFRLCGDETALVIQKSRRVKIWVNKHRVRSGRLAEKAGVDLVLLDDGMQHRKLKRDVEIVMINAMSPFGNGAFFPSGYLRDEVVRLKEADFIFVHGSECPEMRYEVEKEVRCYSDAPIIGSEFATESIDLVAGQGKDQSHLVKVGVFSAIAHPERFYSGLVEKGMEIVDQLEERDHGIIASKVLERFATQAREKGATALICTEKDWVKQSGAMSVSLPIYVARGGLQITSNKTAYNQLIDQLRGRGNRI